MSIFYWLFSSMPLLPLGDLPEKISPQIEFAARLEETQATREALVASYKDDLLYNQACWLTSHNAFATKADGWKYRQQSLSIQDQFKYGVRSFMIDLYWFKNETSPAYIALCHEPSRPSDLDCRVTRRIAGTGRNPQSALDFFRIIYELLDKDPAAIITIHIESYLGSLNKDVPIVDYLEPTRPWSSHLLTLLKEARLTDYLYKVDDAYNISDQNKASPNTPDYWPTLGKLRTDKKRLIIFSDRSLDKVFYTGSYLETEYNLNSYPNCEMRSDRRAIAKDPAKPAEDIKPSKPLLVLNHFYPFSIEVPEFPEFLVGAPYEKINNPTAILKRAYACQKEQGLLPNFIAVDFVEKGTQEGALRASLSINQAFAKSIRLKNCFLDENLALEEFPFGYGTTKPCQME